MIKAVECPLCEHAMPVTSDDKWITCTRCGQKFETTASVAVSVEELVDVAIPPPIPSGSTGPQSSVGENASRQLMGPSFEFTIAVKKQRRSSSSTFRVVFFLILATLSITFAVGAIWYSLITSDEATKGKLPQVSQNTPAEKTTTVVENQIQEIEPSLPNFLADKRKPTTPLEKLRPAAFRYHNQSLADRIWMGAYLSVFELAIERDGEQTFALGTLLDSRGWVVTSYNAVKDANVIRVRNVGSSPLREINPDAFEDVARGILAISPEEDLAIIQINRRLVTTISSLAIASQIPVDGVYCLAGHHPSYQSDAHRYSWVIEARIEQSTRLNNMPPVLQDVAQALNLDETVDWMNDLFSQPPTPGAPVFNPEGQLVGMATSAIAEKYGVVIPASQITTLSANIGELQPFKSNVATQQESSIAIDSGAPELPVGAPELPTGHQQFELSHKFNLQAAECDRWEWTPTNADDLAKMKIYFETAGLVRAIVAEEKLAFKDLDTLENQCVFWEQRLSKAIMNPLKDSVSVLHAITLPVSKFESDDATLVAVKVVQHATLGSKKTYVQAIGQESYFNVDVDPDRFVMANGENWLLVLNQISNKTMNTKLPERSASTSINSRHANVLYFVNLADKGE